MSEEDPWVDTHLVPEFQNFFRRGLGEHIFIVVPGKVKYCTFVVS